MIPCYGDTDLDRLRRLELSTRLLRVWVASLSVVTLPLIVLCIRTWMTPADLNVREIHAEKITLAGSTPTPEAMVHWPGAGPTESWSTTIAPGQIKTFQEEQSRGRVRINGESGEFVHSWPIPQDHVE